MPQVAITLAEGRTPAQIRELIHEVHAAVLRTVHTRPEYIRVVVHEVPRTHWATGDVTLTEMDPAPTEAAGTGAKEQS
ncbi:MULTISPECIES: tautomerase family protein [Streptomyces]|jgi:4-oxalocrotonate tautomerase|uniref:Putative 4-oxalocrotonate tautomerase n=1 Tax=Streptomyces bottropensis ATCC 25435 TaxID=1054862 RepID=M3F5Y0_9ACTN|nr:MULTISPECIES: tautomerase family protein [Streptomyces]EMF57023.1 putative 4-oxalocrotonate tautomerase [Streptomyces bottropensis ATCC 25435]MZD20346.1 4-oxalocrotonate tautomerase [Streptomyces sp. SID5476]